MQFNKYNNNFYGKHQFSLLLSKLFNKLLTETKTKKRAKHGIDELQEVDTIVCCNSLY